MKHVFLTAVAALALTAGADAALAKDKGCPPGLAKKTPACVPPGLAKKGVTAEDWANRGDDDYEVGDRLGDDYEILRVGDRVIFDGEEYVVVSTDGRTILKRGDDYYRLPKDGSYVRVGDSFIRVDPETKAVIEIIQLADFLFG